jgi:hypothetical protein
MAKDRISMLKEYDKSYNVSSSRMEGSTAEKMYIKIRLYRYNAGRLLSVRDRNLRETESCWGEAHH